MTWYASNSVVILQAAGSLYCFDCLLNTGKVFWAWRYTKINFVVPHLREGRQQAQWTIHISKQSNTSMQQYNLEKYSWHSCLSYKNWKPMYNLHKRLLGHMLLCVGHLHCFNHILFIIKADLNRQSLVKCQYCFKQLKGQPCVTGRRLTNRSNLEKLCKYVISSDPPVADWEGFEKHARDSLQINMLK